MKTIVQTIPNDPASLSIGDVPLPEPRNRELLIRVYCAALNRLDLLQAAGRYPVPEGASKVLGVEISGTIIARGEYCESSLSVNDTVMCIVPGGGYSEFCIADERNVMKGIPNIDPDVLCAIPEAFMTAYQLCFKLGNLQLGESALLHAAASSVGQAAIQMLVRKGIKVFATVRSEAKRQRCLELGCTAVLVLEWPTNLSFSDWMKDQNNGQAIDVVLDPVGTAYIEENLDVLNIDGRLVQYGLMGGGSINDPLFLNKMLNKRLSILSTTLRSRSLEYKQHLIECLQSDPDALPAIASGDIKVIIDKRFEMEEVLDAHDYMRRNKNIGKIILMVTSTASAIDFFARELKSLSKRNNLPVEDEEEDELQNGEQEDTTNGHRNFPFK